MAFLQVNWGTVQGDVLTMFLEFYINGKFVASLNATFIGLIQRELMHRISRIIAQLV